MRYDTTTEDILCVTSQALGELHELTKSYEETIGGVGLPVANLVYCIQAVLDEAFRTLEEEQQQGKNSAKGKIKAVAA